MWYSLAYKVSSITVCNILSYCRCLVNFLEYNKENERKIQSLSVQSYS